MLSKYKLGLCTSIYFLFFNQKKIKKKYFASLSLMKTEEL